MSSLREQIGNKLPADYVKQHNLQMRAEDLSIWREFQYKSGIFEKTVESLREEYLQSDECSSNTTPVVTESVNCTWVNSLREGLAQRGLPVRRDVLAMMHNYESFRSGSQYGSFMATPTMELLHSNNSYGAAFADDATPGTITDSSDNDSQVDYLRRSKKKPITNHERFMQIKRNLNRKKHHRRSLRTATQKHD